MTASPAKPQSPRIVIISDGDPIDFNLWSGTPRHMVDALRPYFDVVHIERQPFAWPFPFIRGATSRLTKRKWQLGWSRRFVAMATALARRRIDKSRPDFVFVISQSPLCALIAHKHHVINISDATGSSMLNYYPGFTRLLTSTRNSILAITRDAVLNSTLSLYPSSWAAQSAIKDYGARSSQVAEIAWGPNFKAMPQGHERQLDGTVRLLFVGVEWLRKGGDDVLTSFYDLRKRGFQVELDVVGSAPDGPLPDLPGLRWHGRLDKADPVQAKKLEDLFSAAHLFMMPSHFECWGMVFAEAAAYGLPSIARSTGGITSAVLHDQTGILLPSKSEGKDFSDAIASLLTDPARYTKLSRAALADSRDRLNWTRWAECVHERVVSL